MQKASPLVMVGILGVTALFLSLRPAPKPAPAEAAKTEAVKPAEAAKPADAPKQAPVEPPKPAPVERVNPRPWPQSQSDIPTDAKAVFGSLDNGLRYVIYPNAEPPKRVSLRLHISSGSLMEADDQQGLAHFLEHMVFNGTKHFTAEELVPKMQRLGIGFGAHVNAFTSFDQTVYMLDLPDLSAETMDLGFTVMRDFGDGAKLDAAEIEKERKVILSEKVSRDSVNYRLMEQQFSRLLPDALITRRFPIGDEKVIEAAPPERFQDFYKRYYTPRRMTFVVVGDVSPEDMRGRIAEAFGTMVNPENPGADPDLGKVRQPEGLETAVFHDKEVAATDVSLMLLKPHVAKADTEAARIAEIPLEIAHTILSRRFERISKEKDSPVASGTAGKEELFNFVDLGSINVTAADDRWKDVVPVIEKEFRRALQFGFTETELAEAKSNILNQFEQRVKQKDTRKSENIATALVSDINDGSVASDPETDLAIVSKGLNGIDAAGCHQAFKGFWESAGYDLVLTTKEKPENAEKDLASLFEESRAVPVEPPAARASQVFGYTNFGKPGTVTTRKEVADMGITQLVLSNKVRVNLKPTDFEKGKIRLSARIGSGKLTQPGGSPMLDMFAEAVFEGGGLGKHSNDELQQILAGRNVSSSLKIGEDAFSVSGSTTPGDFLVQCQLMCASLTDPGYREEALWQFQKAIPMIEQQLKHTPAGPQTEMEAWLHGGDARYSVADAEKLNSYTIQDAKKWLTPELTKGYMELSIVGDFQIDAVLPELLGTFGALPARASAPVVPVEARKVKFPNAPASKVFTYESKIAQSIATSIWKTGGLRGNQKEFRRLNILAEILGDRLREEIREKLGASYSPNAGADGSEALDDFGFVISQSVGKPEDTDKLLNTMRDLADKLAREGASADELDRALKPTLAMLEKSLRDNTYWLGTVMSQCQADPKKLDLARTRDADYKSIQLAEINELAKKYLAAEHALQVAIKPSGNGGAADQ